MDIAINAINKITLLLLLVTVYFVLIFHNLGNSESPQLAWYGQNPAIIDFGEPVYISRFQFMTGHVREVPFKVIASLDGENWHFAAIIEQLFPFSWCELHMNTQAKYVQIIPATEHLQLMEAAFRDTNDNIITPYRLLIHGTGHLFDEQHLVPKYISHMNSTYFDETFHARVAYEFIYGITYVDVHPPLGKFLISLSIRNFGMTPFAWRLAGALAGLTLIPLMYLFGWMIFRSHIWASFTAFIFAFDFMPFVQARIATLCIFLTLFVVASYLCMYAYKNSNNLKHSLLYLAGSGLFIGLAIATKWQGLYALAALPFMFFPSWLKQYKEKRQEATIIFGACFVFFIAIPLIIYLLAYIPYVQAIDTDQSFFATVIARQELMLTYHVHLEEGHEFGSNWWEWPIIRRPLLLHTIPVAYNTVSSINSLGNPAVWWMGIIALIYAIQYLIKKKENRQAISFLLIAYAAQFLPWIFVSRVTFIYHYLPSVAFVVMLITFFFKEFVKDRKLILAYSAAVLGLFVLFYPILTGAEVSLLFVERFLRWFPSWVLV